MTNLIYFYYKQNFVDQSISKAFLDLDIEFNTTGIFNFRTRVLSISDQWRDSREPTTRRIQFRSAKAA